MSRWPVIKRVSMQLQRWFNEEADQEARTDVDLDRIDWLRIVPFLALHLGCLLVFWVGWSPVAMASAFLLYAVRMLAITGTYHRYFAHRTYKMSRAWQFFFAVLACTSAQKGPLWWASHHRHHHRFADSPEDAHSPVQRGFWYSHMLWVLTPRFFATKKQLVKNWLKYPELAWLNRHAVLPPLGLLFLLGALGALLQRYVPSAGTSAWQMMIWGFCISTV
ncbi:fatty acid desaturase, partial [Planctomycetota bacterium]